MADKDALQGLRIDREAGATSGGVRRIVIAAVALLIVAAAVWGWLRLPHAIEVTTAVARERPGGAVAAGAVLNASGYVTARRQATVSSKVTGKVVEVLVEEGMAVEEGQPLARLDDSTVARQLALAQAQLGSQRHSLAETQVRLREAGLNRGRIRRLKEQGIATAADLDAAEAQVDSLAARLELGRQEVAVAERQVAVRRQDLEDMVIRAPFTGVAISKDAQPGEMISPVSAGGGFTRTGICTLVDMRSLEVEVDVNEAYINRVKPRQQAVATLDAYPDWQIPTRVITTVPAADRQKATVRVRLGFEQLDPRILPDMGVKVAFLAEPGAPGAPGEGGGAAREASNRPAVVVPRAALRKREHRDVVFVVKGDYLERRAVGVGSAPGDEAIVTSGLAPGEQVVVEGPSDMQDGMKVTVRP